MKQILFIFLFFVVGCSKGPTTVNPQSDDSTTSPVTENRPLPVPHPNGDEVGNGGDFIRIVMEEGKAYAAGILTRIREDAFPSNMSDYLKTGELEWLKANREILLNDILETKQVWVSQLPSDCPKEACGCAFLGEKKIYFSKEQCEGTYSKRQDAAKLIFHETMHHFVGDDEEKAKRLGVALYSAWYNMGHPDSPHWNIFSGPKGLADTYLNVWNGKELMVWGDVPDFSFQNAVALFSPDTESWRYENVKNSFNKIPNNERIHFPVFNPISTSFGIFLFTDYQLNGGRFDMKEKNWTVIPAPLESGVSDKINGTGMAIDETHGIAAWDPSQNIKSVGSIFNPTKSEWSPISADGSPTHNQNAALIWAGDKLFVWEGENFGSDSTAPGALYDPSMKTWTRVAKENAPSPRKKPQLVWTGKEVIVYGGDEAWNDEGFSFANSGAAYNPILNTWRTISPAPAHNLASFQTCTVWTHTEMIVLREGRMDSYNPFLDRWSRGKDSLTYPSFESCPTWTGMEMLSWDSRNGVGHLYYP